VDGAEDAWDKLQGEQWGELPEHQLTILVFGCAGGMQEMDYGGLTPAPPGE
jgi:hypothetical protein